MLILGIETSCDETAASVVEDGRKILSDVVASQIEIHRRYGGVVPEIASRNHTMAMVPVVRRALEEANCTESDIDAVAVTQGGGLIGALLVGVSAAKALSFAWKKPLYAVNHTLAHIAANYVSSDLEPPFLCLVASGGHTVLVRVDSYTDRTVLATTVDDAVGEAFDKVARKLGLPYPGGPQIDRLAAHGHNNIVFTKPNAGDPMKFSYSGLKTAVINYLHKCTQAQTPVVREDVAASFTAAAIDPLVRAVVIAAKESGIRKLALAGGVAANAYLRRAMQEAADALHAQFYMPPPRLCTDNAAMIASLAYFNARDGVGRADMTLNAIATGEALDIGKSS